MWQEKDIGSGQLDSAAYGAAYLIHNLEKVKKGNI